MRTTGAGTTGLYEGRPALLIAAAAASLLALAAGYYVARSHASAGVAPGSFGPLHLLAAAAGVACLVFVVKRPEWGLLLLAAVLYTNFSEIAVRNYGVPSLLQLLAAAVITGATLRRLASGDAARSEFVLDPLLIPLIAYCGVVLASSLFARNPALSDERLIDHFKGLVVFLIVTNLATTQAGLRRVVWALVLSGAFLGAVSLAQVSTHSYASEFGGFGRVKVAQIVGGLREPRISGPLADPNFYAQILVALVPLALYRVLSERAAWLKAAALAALALVAGALVFTYSRGGALAAGGVVALAAVERGVRFRYVTASVALVVLVLMWGPGQYGGRMETLERLLPEEDEAATVHAESSIEQRKLLMGTASEMFEAHPLLGVGAGNYSEHFDEYAAHVGSITPSYENFGERRYPHNLYLEVAAETGLLGLLAFGAAVGGALFGACAAAWRYKRAGEGRAAGLSASVALALVAYLASSLFLHGHYIQYLWLLVALAAVARRAALSEVAVEADA